MAWYLNPALSKFREEVNARWPNRARTSDGTIGDAAHQATSSDHNPDKDGSVDAWDMTAGPGVDVQAVIAAALRHEAIQYVIYNRRITSRSMSGGLGTWHPYTGSNPHTSHVHFNTRESHERSSKPWFTDTNTNSGGKDMAGLSDKQDKRLHAVQVEQRHVNRLWPVVAGKNHPDGSDQKLPLVEAIVEIREGVEAIREAVRALPTQTAEATLAKLGEAPVGETARVLVAVLGAERARELGAALTSGPA
ncbi:hypothetical protein AB0I61_17420 [Polymorphospora rubra]|uniref:hypothetical protein n=1 Tax=Polymorphospora rubra TaxID=338584 RepID=UPI0033C00739